LDNGRKKCWAVLVIEDEIDWKNIVWKRLCRKIVLKNKASKDTFVHEIMDKEIVSVKPTDDLDLLYCIYQ
jgi:signal-transduction protein with cAMP-binding, CBS, and nucleotidyltransferase domain